MSDEIDRLRALLDRWDEVVEEPPCPACDGKGWEPVLSEGGPSRDWCSECGGAETMPVLGAEKVRLVAPQLLAVVKAARLRRNGFGQWGRYGLDARLQSLAAAIREHVPAEAGESEET